MLGKLLIVSVALTAIYFGYQLNKIYVPDNFEKPLSYRFQILAFRLASYASKLMSYATGKNDMILFRNLIDKMFYYSSLYEYAETNIDKLDRKIDNIPIRVFRPKNATHKHLPALLFIHGGGYVMFSINLYNGYMESLSSMLGVVVIAIEYRLAPEHPFPGPVDDCWKTVNYIIDNEAEFGIDKTRIALVGDSAGGNAVAILSQRLASENKQIPKVQVLIYPWLQFYNFKLPSIVENFDKTFGRAGLVFTRLVGLYLGIDEHHESLVSLFHDNEQTLLVENEKEQAKFKDYMNLSRIADEYKLNNKYYEQYNELVSKNLIYPTKLSDKNRKILEKHSDLKKKLQNMFTIDLSPLLANDELLAKLPKTYFIALEWDAIRDEGLLYADRLRKNGVDVHVAYYKDAYHGQITFVSSSFNYKKAIQMRDDLVKYLKVNL